MAVVIKIIFSVLSGCKFLLRVRSCAGIEACFYVKFLYFGYIMQLGVAASEMLFIIYERSPKQKSFGKVTSLLSVEYMYIIQLFES